MGFLVSRAERWTHNRGCSDRVGYTGSPSILLDAQTKHMAGFSMGAQRTAINGAHDELRRATRILECWACWMGNERWRGPAMVVEAIET